MSNEGIPQSVREAQERAGKVTVAQVLAALRAGPDSAYLHGEALANRPSWSDAFVFTLSCTHKHHKSKAETVTKLDLPGTVHGGCTSETKHHTRERSASDPFPAHWVTYAEGFRPRAGYWGLSGMGAERMIDALELLPRDALVSLDLCQDAGTTENHIRASGQMETYTWKGLHCDHLFLVVETTVRGQPKVRRFLIDTSSGPHNSARFGSPSHEADRVGRAG